MNTYKKINIVFWNFLIIMYMVIILINGNIVIFLKCGFLEVIFIKRIERMYLRKLLVWE